MGLTEMEVLGELDTGAGLLEPETLELGVCEGEAAGDSETDWLLDELGATD